MTPEEFCLAMGRENSHADTRCSAGTYMGTVKAPAPPLGELPNFRARLDDNGWEAYSLPTVCQRDGNQYFMETQDPAVAKVLKAALALSGAKSVVIEKTMNNTYTVDFKVEQSERVSVASKFRHIDSTLAADHHVSKFIDTCRAIRGNRSLSANTALNINISGSSPIVSLTFSTTDSTWRERLKNAAYQESRGSFVSASGNRVDMGEPTNFSIPDDRLIDFWKRLSCAQLSAKHTQNTIA